MSDAAMTPLMATPETWTPSRRMRAAAAAEQERIGRELARVTDREQELAGQLHAARSARQSLADELQALQRFSEYSGTKPAGEGARLRVVGEPTPQGEADGEVILLRGAQIRETAVRILASVAGPDEPVHYRDWFALLQARGFQPAGKDPLATFLTQVGRSPLVQRTTSSGTYVLDLDYPVWARQRLRELHEQIAGLDSQMNEASVEDLALTRERRTAINTEIAATERRLEEALRSVGD